MALWGSAGERAPAVPVGTSAGAGGSAEASPRGKASVSGGCGVVIGVVVVVLGVSITAGAVVGAVVDGQLARPPSLHRQGPAALACARLRKHQRLMIGVRPAPVREERAAPAPPRLTTPPGKAPPSAAGTLLAAMMRWGTRQAPTLHRRLLLRTQDRMFGALSL